MMRRFVIAGNWKMHKNVAETSAFIEGLLAAKPSPMVDVVIGPPFTSLPAAAMLATSSGIIVAAQNVHWETTGAFTGEISAEMLRELGVPWVIVGHSERRTLFGETDRTTRDRARAAQAAGLDVIYCIGETLEEREADRTFQVLESQTDGLGTLDPSRLVVAYEPVWAIGTGKTASPDQAQEAHAFVRGCLERAFSADAAAAVRILYGGSMKPGNAHELLSKTDVDGGLIGGASLDVDSFSAIIRAAADCAAGE
jgi:triosephosphate isomerase